jgi:hypothetical protein
VRRGPRASWGFPDCHDLVSAFQSGQQGLAVRSGRNSLLASALLRLRGTRYADTHSSFRPSGAALARAPFTHVLGEAFACCTELAWNS